MSAARTRQRGFTLTELVMTITVIGILAVIVAPRFMSARPFESRGLYDQAQAVVRYAQKLAIAERNRRTITVCIAADQIKAVAGADCSVMALPHPSMPGRKLETDPGPVTLAPVGSFTFDGLGRPSVALPGYTITLTSSVAGDPPRQIVVAAETGYVSR